MRRDNPEEEILLIFSLTIYVIITQQILLCGRIGLVSYCLVIYYQNYKSYSSDTVLSNRIGEGLITTGFIIMYIIDVRSCIYMIILLAAITKRARISFPT